MSKKELFQKWKKIAEDDLKMAELALQNSLWLHCVFHCQQSVEKMLKGFFVLYLEKDPPYTHDLARLYKGVLEHMKGFPFNERRFAALSVFYISSRYPSYKAELSNNLDKNSVYEFVKLAKDLIEWNPPKKA